MMLAEKNICTGCGSCAAACIKNCITMQSDGMGFRYPEIDENKCILCRNCERTCPVIHTPAVGLRPEFLAVRNRNVIIREQSSSGGVFSALAEYVYSQGGIVCAAMYDASFKVVHALSADYDDLRAFRGAKYAQSECEQCFEDIRAAVMKNIPVLFVGTPCQTAGLRTYLGRDYDSLLLCDMICHGVPSPVVWKEYLAELSSKENSRISAVNLRNKKSGWSGYNYSAEYCFENGSCILRPQRDDPYMRGFVGNLFLRPSCAECKFKGAERSSDFTLGDYWGIWNQHPEFDDDKGVSLLIIQSPKGKKLWQSINAGFETIAVSCEDALRENPSAMVSSVPHTEAQIFQAAVCGGKTVEEAINAVLNPRYEKTGILDRIKNKLRGLL